MKHLSELRKQLSSAEITYKEADSSLDSSPIALIVAREELKQLRFTYDKACTKLAEALMRNPFWMRDAHQYINVEEY